MPADKNLLLFSNYNLATSSTSPAVDIGMGGTPVDHPLVARFFWGSAAASATISVSVEASYDNTTFRQVSVGNFLVGPNAEPKEGGVPFYTRRRYVRGTISGGAANGVSVDVNAFARNSREQYLD